ncbi:hypothetical protein, partial [Pseudoalteromonas peptidolytica]|uniref:hypothetical protein n=1 Tax=Pseudoalteromonas peptidolytica TaxID=61150 RepID=UPI001ABF8F35
FSCLKINHLIKKIGIIVLSIIALLNQNALKVAQLSYPANLYPIGYVNLPINLLAVGSDSDAVSTKH